MHHSQATLWASKCTRCASKRAKSGLLNEENPVLERHKKLLHTRERGQMPAQQQSTLIRSDKSQGNFVDVTSGELYRMVGGHAGRDYRMATCCNVMMAAKRNHDIILASPQKGRGAMLTIRHVLPR